VGPIEAAITNGELAHSDETDDDYTGGGAHPGSAVVPATLAIGEKVGISGQHFTRAVALGYDVGMRAFQTVGVEGSILNRPLTYWWELLAPLPPPVRDESQRPAMRWLRRLCRHSKGERLCFLAARYRTYSRRDLCSAEAAPAME